ncbi:hypothetical protein HDU76_010833, partial [Blyttiomyces sp. JEL0837]
PYVAATFSWLVSSTAAANFLSDNGLPSTDFISQVGHPRLARYDDEETTLAREFGAATENCCLTTLLLHPGYFKYGEYDPSLLIFMYWTTCWTIRLIELARKVAEERKGRLSRFEIVKLIISCLEKIMLGVNLSAEDTHLGEVWKEVEAACAELLKYIQRKSEERRVIPRELSVKTKQLMSERTVERIARAQVALGEPQSAQRKGQLLKMQKLNMKDAFIHLGGFNDDWFDNKKPEWLSHISNGLFNLLNQFGAPEGAVGFDWMLDPRLLEEGRKKIGWHLKGWENKLRLDRGYQQKMALKKWDKILLEPTPEWKQGVELTINASGRVRGYFRELESLSTSTSVSTAVSTSTLASSSSSSSSAAIVPTTSSTATPLNPRVTYFYVDIPAEIQAVVEKASKGSKK